MRRERNIQSVRHALEGESLDLAVIPELFASGYFFKSAEDVFSMAEDIPDGPTTQALIDMATRHQCHIVAGLPERAGANLYNSAVLVGPEGFVGSYRKVHLFYEEKRWFKPGDLGFPVFDLETRNGYRYRLGIMICFDWFFPESARSLMLNGAEVIAHPSNLVKEWCPSAMPIRALENSVFTATGNRTGTESNDSESLTFIGSSLICGPDGSVRAKTDRLSTGWITAECDVEQARNKSVTAFNDIVTDRQPHAYVEPSADKGSSL